MAQAVKEQTLLCSEPDTVTVQLLFLASSVAMVCWTLHYAKRLLETLFVHRFSHATMPLRNLFKV